MNRNKQIKFILNELLSKKIIKSIDRYNTFYDEPSFFLYYAPLGSNENYSDKKIPNNSLGAGISISPHIAILKCLVECIERFCSYCYRNKSMPYLSYKEIKNYALDPALFDNNSSLREEKLGWIKGFNLSNDTTCLVPTQLVYLNYKKRGDEIILPQPGISTGTAGGFDHESTLLRGIYEVIERDSFMTIYLNKIQAPKIDLTTIKNKTVQLILDSCERYRLELQVFDIATDLGIPSFLSLIIDRTGLGTAVSCGAKSNLNAKLALTESILESFLVRFWMRSKLFESKLNIPRINPYAIDTNEKRGFFWSPTRMLEHLNFLLNQKPVTFRYNRLEEPKQELSKVKELFEKRQIKIFYVDITLPIFKKLGIIVYKAIIPNLQPLYLIENKKIVRIGRLKEVSKFFGQEKVLINNTPHPFV